jgi:hypothetical protein
MIGCGKNGGGLMVGGCDVILGSLVIVELDALDVIQGLVGKDV